MLYKEFELRCGHTFTYGVTKEDDISKLKSEFLKELCYRCIEKVHTDMGKTFVNKNGFVYYSYSEDKFYIHYNNKFPDQFVLNSVIGKERLERENLTC